MHALRRWGVLAIGVMALATVGLAPGTAHATMVLTHHHPAVPGNDFCEGSFCPGDKDCPKETYGKLIACANLVPHGPCVCKHYPPPKAVVLVKYQDSDGPGTMALTVGESDTQGSAIAIGVQIRQGDATYSGQGFMEAFDLDWTTGTVAFWIDFTLRGGYEFYGWIYDDGDSMYGEGQYSLDGVAIDEWQIAGSGE